MDAVPREPAFLEESEAYTLFQRGLSFLRHQHPAQAAMLLSKALRLEPGKNSIREALGRSEFAVGRYAAAADHFATIIATAPDNDYAHYALGRSLLKLGRGEEAQAHLRLACALRPANGTYRDALTSTG